MDSSTGSKSFALFSACSLRTLALALFPFRATLAMIPPRSPPSTTPRALAAARAAFVRSEIILASCSATAARMWTVNLFAVGKSQAVNSTPDSIRLLVNATFRAKRSNLAITSVALWMRHSVKTSMRAGRLLILPVSTSVRSAISFQWPPFR